ncbi:OprD family outer membrane porin [Pantoea sp. App145]|uniref:OprD family outer membrane porin n=1 Tax=Pantoea sp. App145 TaxID=3071567 RepID=UPI003A813C5D
MNKKIYSLLLLSFASSAHAQGFWDDSKLVLDTRVLSYDRDWRSGSGQSYGQETASLTQLKYQSGYTPGLVGFGFDFNAMAALKLNSSKEHSGVLLKKHGDGEAYNYAGKFMPTFKTKVSNTVINAGSMVSYLPVLLYDGAVLPQVYRGVRLSSQEIPNLTLNAGHFTEVMNRSATHYTPIQLATTNGRYKTINSRKNFNYLGGEYQFTDLALNARYYYAQFVDVYDQQFVGATKKWQVGPGALTTDFRGFYSKGDGSHLAGKIDNTLYSGLLSYSLGVQKLNVSYQRSLGDTAFPYISGTDPYLTNYQLIGSFSETGEHSWKVQYDYNFRNLGIPGLTISNMYISGGGIERSGYTGKEWERNTDITYSFDPHGIFKNVRLKWRNGTYRSNFTRNVDENRFFIFYSIALK